MRLSAEFRGSRILPPTLGLAKNKTENAKREPFVFCLEVQTATGSIAGNLYLPYAMFQPRHVPYHYKTLYAGSEAVLIFTCIIYIVC
jgi:hypothetical protein